MRSPAAFVLAILTCFPMAAMAQQTDFTNLDSVQTRFGSLTLVENDIGYDVAHFDGRSLGEDVTNWSLSIRGAFGRGDEAFDYVLLSDHAGGNACDPPLRVLRVSADGVQVGPTIGGCVSPDVLEVRVLSGAIEIDTPHRDIGIEREIWMWNGTDLTRTEVPAEEAATVAGPGADAQRWVGEHPYRLFENASERARFGEIMRDWQMEELATRIGPANAVIERDGWVLGAGCMAHNCDVRRGVWGIRIADGVPAAATIDRGLTPRTFGDAAIDPIFRSWVDEHRP